MNPPYQDRVLRSTFGATTFQRAVDYVRRRRVINTHFEGGTLESVVMGSERLPYQQQIDLSDPDAIVGYCSCPIGYNCKHVAAALMVFGNPAANLDSDPTREPTSTHEVIATPGKDEGEGDRALKVGENRAPAPVPARVKIDPETLLNPNLAQWLRSVKSTAHMSPSPPGADAVDAAPPTQAWLFIVSNQIKGSSERSLFLSVVSAKLLINGTWGQIKPLKRTALQTGNLGKFVTEEERVLVAAAERNFAVYNSGGAVILRLSGFDSQRYLDRFLETRKCRWEHPNGGHMRAADSREAKFAWQINRASTQSLTITTTPPALVIPTLPPRFVDTVSAEIGLVDSGMPEDAFVRLFGAPDVLPIAAFEVRKELRELFPDREELWPVDFGEPEMIQVKPRPILSLSKHNVRDFPRSWRDPYGPEYPVYFLSVSFDYHGERVGVNQSKPHIASVREGKAIVYVRDYAEEDSRLKEIGGAGVTKCIYLSSHFTVPKGFGDAYVVGDARAGSDAGQLHSTLQFVRNVAPELERKGWCVEVPDELNIVEPDDDWHLELGHGSNNWFELSLGVDVDGGRMDLLPVLVQALREFSPRELKEPDPERMLYHRLADGRLAAFSVARLAPLVNTLIEIFGRDASLEGRVKVPLPNVADLLAIEDEPRHGLVWSDPEGLRDIGRRLRNLETISPIEPPEGLRGTLRPYQLDGLAWLQFIREFHFGAILADDMGLGKTIQTIAHILVEKAAGRLTKPALIVAPTSTLPNWSQELERFAPLLTVMVAQGADRKKTLRRIGETDVILTTYPLLTRDAKELCAHTYHLLVLDEAQNIKNAKTATWQAAKAISANHRLCLTGTPLENHLGELWSLFEFLMPGFLGTSEAFRRRFRTPIEVLKSPEATERLTRTVRPFMLRRTKEAVASELPPKIEMIERIELAGPQRDLYESLRLAMSRRVREEIAARGLGRSHIVVLDALLKLRQACCDPRLVKTESAKLVKGSAKLDRLIEMAEELKAEGRKALVFSQFTSMLALIEERLQQRGIDYVLLTGSTTDRATPVQRFQNGEVTLFLISLKAGGTGLNLTAADTVIHYDPWWNPAVERQATDRAHRIGQTKSVFVHKLVAQDTVEERILELQARKSDLADALLSGNSEAKLAFTPEDVEWFFGP